MRQAGWRGPASRAVRTDCTSKAAQASRSLVAAGSAAGYRGEESRRGCVRWALESGRLSHSLSGQKTAAGLGGGAGSGWSATAGSWGNCSGSGGLGTRRNFAGEPLHPRQPPPVAAAPRGSAAAAAAAAVALAVCPAGWRWYPGHHHHHHSTRMRSAGACVSAESRSTSARAGFVGSDRK